MKTEIHYTGREDIFIYGLGKDAPIIIPVSVCTKLFEGLDEIRDYIENYKNSKEKNHYNG